MHRFLVAGCASVLLFVVAAAAAEKRTVVSVYSRADSSYKRKKLPDGSFQPEYYAISNGGMVEGTTRDNAQDSMDITVIVKAVAEHLAQQKYLLAPDAKKAELMLVVQWGRTIPFNDLNYSGQVNTTGEALATLQNLSRGPDVTGPAPSAENAAAVTEAQVAANQERTAAISSLESAMVAMQMQNKMRDDLNTDNARLLGYMDDINDSNDIARYAGRGDHYNDLVGDIEESRYYIIISAYDFHRLVDKNEKKLRWVTRISIRVRGNKFGERVAEMVARASRYFGQNSGKLVREYEGTVEYGEAEVIGVVEDPPAPPPASSESPPAPPPPPATPDQPK